MVKNPTQSNQAKTPKLRFPGFEGVWEEKKLGQIAKFSSDRISVSDLKKENFIGVDNLLPNLQGKTESQYLPKTGKVSKFSKGDILHSNIRPYLKKAWQADTEGGSSADVLVIKPNGTIDSLFLYRQITSDLYFDYVMSGTKGVKMPRGDKNYIMEFGFCVPQLLEQQKIASFLGEVDAWIGNLREQKKSLESYKKSLMQKIFSQQIRFKDEKGDDFTEWEEKKIEDVFQVTRGHVLAVKDMSEVKTEEFLYPVYSSQTKDGGLIGYYDDFLFENSITWTTDGANAGDVNFRKGKFYCTNVCGVLISNEGYANECIAQLLNTIAYKFVSKVGNPKLMNNIMSKIKINFPSLPEQQKIADLLTSVDKNIESKQQQITEAEEWKKGLMQGLFV